jgi:hypothetical protein
MVARLEVYAMRRSGAGWRGGEIMSSHDLYLHFHFVGLSIIDCVFVFQNRQNHGRREMRLLRDHYPVSRTAWSINRRRISREPNRQGKKGQYTGFT